MRVVPQPTMPQAWRSKADKAFARLNGGADLDSTVWQAAKEGLYAKQSGKCCYCENRYEMAYSDVEHFRPKSAYRWLAYAAPNLFFACANCNRPKGEDFPVGGKRLHAPQMPWVRRAWRQERPKLLNPNGTENSAPEDHLCFVPVAGAWRIAARNGSPRGRATIRACTLDRDDLNQLRQEHVDQVLQPLLNQWTAPGADHAALRARAQQLAAPGMRFSLLARDYFHHHRVF
jgi:uncharacterized protein (TIGR02646 family)